MLARRALTLLALWALTACAQVPRESVELSATVGRDVVAVQKSHRELAALLFARMRDDVDRFIDRVYAPYQVKAVMDSDFRNATSSQEADRRVSVTLALGNALKPGASDQLRRQATAGMSFLVSEIRQDIESKRLELLRPIRDQEAQVMAAIDRSYAQIIYANSVVTGHLASVVKVHDAQSQVLDAIGADANLSAVVGSKLAAASGRLSDLVRQAEGADASAASIEAALADLKRIVSGR